MEQSGQQKVENILRDTRKNVRYIILASRKLTREEKLRVLRLYNYDPQNLKTKPNSTIIIESDI
ncbi:MAG: hypothetical protein CH6_1135 [Candidatus Kapaibacterium sp.]|jgi:hypothetical protein|nr:MAG: hypothetical protein CH6_1135 [Candidatus Kapabacteria bacterium]ROL55940.1 MAG: hypothetical protein D9V84_09880 [Bacteroidetes/Chlorobi group bacterium Naka2016]